MDLRCIIIDDEPPARELLEDYIKEIPFLSWVGSFPSPVEALPHILNENPDVIFLDIQMPKLTGMDFLKTVDLKPMVILTTAYEQYAVESYELKVLDYILKPVSFDRFLMAINKAIAESNKQPEIENAAIFVKSNRQLIQIHYSNLYYITGLKDYVQFHTASDTLVVYHSLKKLEKILPNNFIRVHHSFVVNINLVKKLKNNHLYVLEERIPLSEKYRDQVLRIIEEKSI